MADVFWPVVLWFAARPDRIVYTFLIMIVIGFTIGYSRRNKGE